MSGSIAGMIASASRRGVALVSPGACDPRNPAIGRTSEAVPPAQARAAVLVARFQTMASSLETPPRVGSYDRKPPFTLQSTERQHRSSNPSRIVMQNPPHRQRGGKDFRSRQPIRPPQATCQYESADAGEDSMRADSRPLPITTASSASSSPQGAGRLSPSVWVVRDPAIRIRASVRRKARHRPRRPGRASRWPEHFAPRHPPGF